MMWVSHIGVLGSSIPSGYLLCSLVCAGTWDIVFTLGTPVGSVQTSKDCLRDFTVRKGLQKKECDSVSVRR